MFYTFICILLPLPCLTVLYRFDSNGRDDDRQPGGLEKPCSSQRKSWLLSLTGQLKSCLTLGRRLPATTKNEVTG